MNKLKSIISTFKIIQILQQTQTFFIKTVKLTWVHYIRQVDRRKRTRDIRKKIIVRVTDFIHQLNYKMNRRFIIDFLLLVMFWLFTKKSVPFGI